MAERRQTLVAAPTRPEGEWTWLPPRVIQQAHGDIAALGAACRGQPIWLLVPTESVTLTVVDLPIRNVRELERALPFALEERLVDDVADLHFVVAERSTTAVAGPRTAAVMRLAEAEGWLMPLRMAGLRPLAVIPDALVLPWEPGIWSLALTPTRLRVRFGPALGVAVEVDAMGAWLERLLREQGVPQAVRVWAEAGADVAPIEAFVARHDLPLSVEGSGSDPLVQAREVLGAGAVPIDLQQGRLREVMRGSARLWQVAAGLAVLAFGVQVTDIYLRTQSLKDLTAALDATTEERFRSAFPEVRRIVNLRAQAEQALAQLTRGELKVDDFLGLLNQGSTALGAAGAPRLATLDYRAGRLEIDLDAPDMPSVERCQQALKGAGLTVELVSADSRPDGVHGRLRISGGGS